MAVVRTVLFSAVWIGLCAVGLAVEGRPVLGFAQLNLLRARYICLRRTVLRIAVNRCRSQSPFGLRLESATGLSLKLLMASRKDRL